MSLINKGSLLSHLCSDSRQGLHNYIDFLYCRHQYNYYPNIQYHSYTCINLCTSRVCEASHDAHELHCTACQLRQGVCSHLATPFRYTHTVHYKHYSDLLLILCRSSTLFGHIGVMLGAVSAACKRWRFSHHLVPPLASLSRTAPSSTHGSPSRMLMERLC